MELVSKELTASQEFATDDSTRESDESKLLAADLGHDLQSIPSICYRNFCLKRITERDSFLVLDIDCVRWWFMERKDKYLASVRI